MLRLRDIMTTDAVTVSPETTIREAMEILSRRHVSGAPVVSGGTLLGVVSGTDLMGFAAALSGVPTERDTNDDWVEWPEPAIDLSIEEEDEPGSTYFSSMWDDAGAEVTGRMATPGGPEWNVLEEHDVSEVMTHTPLSTLGPDDTVERAADLMQRNSIHRVLIVEDDRLVGIVSSLDITKAAAEHRLVNRTYVFNRAEGFDGRR